MGIDSANDAGPGTTDGDLVRRVRDGDESAARALFDRHAAELRARVRARLPDLLRRKVGESDVLQQAYLAAFLRLADFEDRGEGSFGRWIGRILEHKVRDEVRRYLGTEKRAAALEVPAGGESGVIADPPDAAPSPSAAAVARESREELQRVIAGLPDSHREILQMVHGRGWTLREVTEQTGRSEVAVRKAYGRALAAFREALDADGGSEAPVIPRG